MWEKSSNFAAVKDYDYATPSQLQDQFRAPRRS